MAKKTTKKNVTKKAKKNSKLDTQAFSANLIIQKKRDGGSLTTEEVKWFIDSYTAGTIPDYQMSALLMAIFIRGFNTTETAALTDSMLYSGDVLDFKDITVIDKHSTGGIGDKTSFILAPIAAACGVKVPMIAGRGLGHTGGTVDKVESIKGFNTSLTMKQFSEQLKKKGQVLIGQTKEIAPADKKIYGLRDVTGTVESIPLITASIMSKKLAEGASGIVMDVKTGSGAFMQTLPDAKALAKSIRETALRFNKNIITMITNMDEPLGHYIGNSLEMIESIETLRGKGPKDLTDLSVELAGAMVYLAKKAPTLKAGVKMAQEALDSGVALDKFRELIALQGGDASYVDDYSKFPMAEYATDIVAPKNGYVKSIDGKALGLYVVDLGGGRKASADKIDFGVGFVTFKKVGDKIKKGEKIVTVYHHKHQAPIIKRIEKEMFERVFEIAAKPGKKIPLIIETTTSWSK